MKNVYCSSCDRERPVGKMADNPFTEVCQECLDIRARAYDLHVSEDVEFDPEPKVSIGEDGAWVQAWVFVPNNELPNRGDQ